MGYYQQNGYAEPEPPSNRRLIRWLAIAISFAAILSCIAVVFIWLRTLEPEEDPGGLDALISQITTQTAQAEVEPILAPDTEPAPSATPVLAGVATATEPSEQDLPTRINTQIATATVTPFAQEPTETQFVPPTHTVAPTVTNTPDVAPTALVAILPGNNSTVSAKDSDDLTSKAAPVGITIDGQFYEWPGLIGVTTPFQIAGTQKPANNSDIGSAAYMLWDANYLYLKIEVIDDVVVQVNNNNEIYNGDSIEIDFDLDLLGDKDTKSNADDFMIIATAGDFGGIGPRALRYEGAFTGDNAKEFGHNIFIAASKTAMGYQIELAIPWTDLGGTSPNNGTEIGYALTLNDVDTYGSTVVETVLSNASDRERREPQTWGTLTFEN